MHSLLEKLDEDQKKKLVRKKQPSWKKPMLAKLSHEVFADENWIYERKLDGERCLAFKNGNKVTLLSRNQQNLNISYPEIVEAIQKQEAGHFIIDGEIVAFEGNLTSFEALQKRMNLSDPEAVAASNTRVFYYVFDVIYLEGYDLSELDLRARKKILKDMLQFADPIRYTPHINENGTSYHAEACKKGWEGIMAKRSDSTYVHKRSSDWLKMKCTNQQEFVIAGYTDPQGDRTGFGALLIGFYKNAELFYAGKVGTGFDENTLKELHGQMQKIETDTPAFADKKSLPKKNVHWLKPKLVAEVGFTEWTKNDKTRHPRYLGLRHDKNATDMVQEK